MNLEVNFVNNFRMKNNEYRIAADAFRDVLDRYEHHAFAYYYLSKALTALHEVEAAKDSLRAYQTIIKHDVSWREYARHFNLI
jgi:TolA-binding protein